MPDSNMVKNCGRSHTEEDIMSKTEENLKKAFTGESQANRRYLAFAKQAEREGYPQAAKLFRAVAEAETVHALSHLRAMGGIGTTIENLRAALSGETHEFEEMYPPMIEASKQEGNQSAERSFSYANEVEKVHAGLYQKALNNLKTLENLDYHICSVCGYTAEGEAPEKCPLCGANSKAFFKSE